MFNSVLSAQTRLERDLLINSETKIIRPKKFGLDLPADIASSEIAIRMLGRSSEDPNEIDNEAGFHARFGCECIGEFFDGYTLSGRRSFNCVLTRAGFRESSLISDVDLDPTTSCMNRYRSKIFDSTALMSELIRKGYSDAEARQYLTMVCGAPFIELESFTDSHVASSGFSGRDLDFLPLEMCQDAVCHVAPTFHESDVECAVHTPIEIWIQGTLKWRGDGVRPIKMSPSKTVQAIRSWLIDEHPGEYVKVSSWYANAFTGSPGRHLHALKTRQTIVSYLFWSKNRDEAHSEYSRAFAELKEMPFNPVTQFINEGKSLSELKTAILAWLKPLKNPLRERFGTLTSFPNFKAQKDFEEIDPRTAALGSAIASKWDSTDLRNISALGPKMDSLFFEHNMLATKTLSRAASPSFPRTNAHEGEGLLNKRTLFVDFQPQLVSAEAGGIHWSSQSMFGSSKLPLASVNQACPVAPLLDFLSSRVSPQILTEIEVKYKRYLCTADVKKCKVAQYRGEFGYPFLSLDKGLGDVRYVLGSNRGALSKADKIEAVRLGAPFFVDGSAPWIFSHPIPRSHSVHFAGTEVWNGEEVNNDEDPAFVATLCSKDGKRWALFRNLPHVIKSFNSSVSDGVWYPTESPTYGLESYGVFDCLYGSFKSDSASYPFFIRDPNGTYRVCFDKSVPMCDRFGFQNNERFLGLGSYLTSVRALDGFGATLHHRLVRKKLEKETGFAPSGHAILAGASAPLYGSWVIYEILLNLYENNPIYQCDFKGVKGGKFHSKEEYLSGLRFLEKVAPPMADVEAVNLGWSQGYYTKSNEPAPPRLITRTESFIDLFQYILEKVN